MLPASYPATASLGLAVLQMVAFTPFLLIQRWRRKSSLLQVAISMRPGTDDDALTEAVAHSLRTLGIESVHVEEATGIESWPMRTVGFAARHLIGAVVRGEPMRLRADGLKVFAYATNVAVLGPSGRAYRARAALSRELPLAGARLAWSDEAQAFEDELMRIREETRGPAAMRSAMDELQEKIDATKLDADEWNILYRLRLQIEQAAVETRGRRDRAITVGAGKRERRGEAVSARR
jgi:hypothetical protein